MIVYVILKTPGQEALRYLVEQADVLLFVHRALGEVEETPERCYHVLEEVADGDFNFNFIWHVIEIRVVIIEKLVSIIRLKEVEVTFDALL